MMWLDHQTGYLDATLAEINELRLDLFTLPNRLTNGDTGALDYANQSLQYANILALERRTIMYEDRELQYDQTWYLQQIYSIMFSSNDNDDQTDDPSDDIPEVDQIETTTANLHDLHSEHKDLIGEYNNDFSLPDTSMYTDEEDPPTLEIQYEFDGWFAGLPDFDIQVDLTPFAGIRLLVHSAVYFLTTIQAIFIIWKELEKK